MEAETVTENTVTEKEAQGPRNANLVTPLIICMAALIDCLLQI